ncbi:hypothetical protein BAUCODRAFT_313103 [Baudoinia panamericana UAMH 10762]|uniref:Uncharacterized protein n=1 Tax=Baudoinia panamericana (strain UAMH 10762) TaxID=717646 RepID=M2N0B3_BAUPA|nr:uncharacterized protein BAUCODRAFT_313103 [Baudoinia panamericana UAMH 10762]EMC92005.1 hypothetical protein BAUCODRAFT_313103 [Baudoinia panamericana UAMH 10762]
MLAIEPPKSTRQLKPNLLPCTIHHNGPLKVSKRYWSPKINADGTSTAYLRGRKLKGRTLKLPTGYQGVLLQKTDRDHVPSNASSAAASKPALLHSLELDEAEEAEGGEGEVKLMESKGTFDEVMVWGHELVPDDEDAYVRGLREWMAFAEAVR